MISFKNMYYSFNYMKNKFVQIDEKEIIQSIEEKKVGIYLNEKIPFLTNKGVKALS